MPDGAKVPFGRAPNGQLATVKDVDRGATDLTCPACNAPLIARKGGEIVHHLAHASHTIGDHACAETIQHIALKEAAFHMIGNGAKGKITLANHQYLVLRSKLEFHLANINKRPDITAILGDNSTLALEIRISNAKSTDDILAFASGNIEAWELDGREYTPDTNPKDFIKPEKWTRLWKTCTDCRQPIIRPGWEPRCRPCWEKERERREAAERARKHREAQAQAQSRETERIRTEAAAKARKAEELERAKRIAFDQARERRDAETTDHHAVDIETLLRRLRRANPQRWAGWRPDPRARGRV